MTQPSQQPCRIDAIVFDFGGVLAEEGFRNGLRAIARRNGFATEEFVKTGFRLAYESGYVTGRCTEGAFWSALRAETGLGQSDEALREEVLSHFVIRPSMITLVGRLKESGVTVAVLSDQVNWLNELDSRHHFFRWFDRVFNSYHLGKSKKDVSIFRDVTKELGVNVKRTLFVDDHGSNVERARQAGLEAILYRDERSFRAELRRYCPAIDS